MSFAAISPTDDYELLLQQAAALLHGEPDAIANAANLSAFIFQAVADLNWAGFYFMRDGELVLGPFQGMPACVRIAVGKGVCGTAAAEQQTQRVEDVDAFPGHIACDSASRSEVVVPLVREGKVIGVLDIDSPKLARFGVAEQRLFEGLAQIWLEASAPL